MSRSEPVQESIRIEIARRGLSCYRIANDLGLSESTVGRFVNGGKSLRGDSIDKLADYLGLELRPVSERRGEA